jgi:hypothetical protein
VSAPYFSLVRIVAPVLALLLAASAGGAADAPKALVGLVVRIVDGDTITVRLSNRTESEGNINASRALAPPPLRPVPRPSRPQPRTPPPAGAAGTAGEQSPDPGADGGEDLRHVLVARWGCGVKGELP